MMEPNTTPTLVLVKLLLAITNSADAIHNRHDVILKAAAERLLLLERTVAELRDERLAARFKQ